MKPSKIIYTEEIYSFQTTTVFSIIQAGVGETWMAFREEKNSIIVYRNLDHYLYGPGGLEVSLAKYNHYLNTRATFDDILEDIESNLNN